MNIKNEANRAIKELVQVAKLKAGNLIVIGCSSSEILGSIIGQNSSYEVALEVAEAVYPFLTEQGIAIAAQCCEHLNRALIIEKEEAEKRNLEIVNVVPKPKAGGSFATAIYSKMKEPVAVEHIKADAGLDIGLTLIGMHLKDVAVPLRLSTEKIGHAHITAARTRPKFIGGARANYDEEKI